MKINKINNFIKKIGTINLLSLLFVFLLLGSFFFYLFRKKQYVTVTLKVSNNSIFNYGVAPEYNLPKADYLKAIQPGLVAKGELGIAEAEILDVYSYDFNSEDKVLFATVRLNAAYSSRSGQYTYRELPVVIGSHLKINFPNLLVEGLVIDINNQYQDDNEETIIFDAEVIRNDINFPGTTGAPKFIAEALSIGDKVFDHQGRVMAEIIDKQVSLADQLSYNDRGIAILTKNPLRDKIKLRVKAKVRKVNGELWFYELSRIQVDKWIPLMFDNISIYPVITSFEEIPVED